MQRASLLGILWVMSSSAVSLPAAEPFDPLRFEREVLVPAAADPVALDLTPDGAVYFIERPGAVKSWHPAAPSVRSLGVVPSLTKADAGCLGMALAPDFATTGHLYLLYVPESGGPVLRVSRFTVKEGTLDAASEKILLAMPLEGRGEPAHCGGGLAWDTQGNLLVGVGDNSPPQDVPAVHPTEAPRDSRRTAGNSQDWRGKILRLTPTADGGYTVPKGNLFDDPAEGRPEIYVMGTRNPFRISVDPETGWIVWGDVGGNVDPALDLGPEGYDELNLAKAPGFFGWPFCSGPNAPWRSFDPRTLRPQGDWFEPARPTNTSPANTGLKALPPSQPAVLWYPTSASPEWPQLGSGGRSITGGPVYRFARFAGSDIRLPEAYDGAVIWGEWMRNFLAVARLSPDGTLTGVERVMPGTVFRKPSDMKIGPDGALYIAEYGDAWAGNSTGQITRLVYRRGNRPPRAVAVATPAAGPAPLRVTLDARGSTDPDRGDTAGLTFEWRIAGAAPSSGALLTQVIEAPGRHDVELIVRDPHGADSRTRLTVDVGNAPPVVRFTEPADGGFFEFGRPLGYRVEANDPEDGALGAEKLSLHLERRDRARVDDESMAYPGLALMRSGTCFSCHRAAEKSAGPAYLEVARRYAPDPAARDTLAQKILRGGAGVWGEIPMPPHPQHTADQARLMIDWILSLAARDTRALPASNAGTLTVDPPPREWGAFSNGVLVLTAAATDAGSAAVPPLSAEAHIILRTRRQMAAAFDRAERTTTQHNLESGLVARVSEGGWIAFEKLRLADVSKLLVNARHAGGGPARVEVRAHAIDGPRLATAELPVGGATRDRRTPPLSLDLDIPDDLLTAPVDVVIRLVGDPSAVGDFEWVEFK